MDPTPTTERVTDVMDPARAAALHAVLGLPGDPPSVGDALLPFAHHVYFWAPKPPAQLGRDGHPALGGLIPDLGLSRRMWAGGRVHFHAPLLLGRPAERHSAYLAQRITEGRTGRLALVTLRHRITQDGATCLTEEQDLIYRAEASPDAPRPIAPSAPDSAEAEARLTFDPVLLFRYSALTLNGHRIHYDRPYATAVEGYGGCVVHGPLLAQRLVLTAEAALGPLDAFSFRATAPLLDCEEATLCRTGAALWIRGPGGRLCMRAEASPA